MDEDEDIVDDEVDALKPAFLRLLMMRLREPVKNVLAEFVR